MAALVLYECEYGYDEFISGACCTSFCSLLCHHTGRPSFISHITRFDYPRKYSINSPITKVALSLNPVEHIWEEVREKHFYNQVFDSMHSVIDTLCQELKELMDMPERLRSLTNFPHLRITF
ncbi:hypothetical protein [Tolypothrix sp. VBCCA 56010]|uniref:hypothetical protein n=1 Tax=Tolypothrix sp. VBCCA 56010 TaxID=3137731 RepID=UPI003D7CC4E2